MLGGDWGGEFRVFRVGVAAARGCGTVELVGQGGGVGCGGSRDVGCGVWGEGMWGVVCEAAGMWGVVCGRAGMWGMVCRGAGVWGVVCGEEGWRGEGLWGAGGGGLGGGGV